MEKKFSQKEAAKAFDRLTRLNQDLSAAWKSAENLRSNIKTRHQLLVQKSARGLLATIPIEEIGKNIQNIRLKGLHDIGIHTYLDLEKSSEFQIARAHGISKESAAEIKKAFNDFAREACKTVQIKLNADNKDPESSALVQAISIYRNCLSHLESCHLILTKNEPAIRSVSLDIKPAIEKSKLKWFFTGREIKNRAIQANDTIVDMLNGEFGSQAEAELECIQKYRKTSITEAWEDFEKNSIDFFIILENLCPSAQIQVDNDAYGLSKEVAEEIRGEGTPLEGFKSSLRRYQEWGVKYILHQGRVLLGDDMGLGKTIQAIASMVILRNTGARNFMVICPASVITNWCVEIEKHSDLNFYTIHGPKRGLLFREWKEKGGVAVTTYETLRTLPLEPGFTFSMLIVDEAHYIKNPKALRSQNVRRFCEHTGRILFMTGTALENRVDEMLYLLEILRPEIARKARRVSAMSKAPEFAGAVAPVYYRRKKEQVLTELPELIESEEWCDISDAEVEAYEEAILKGNVPQARQVSWNIDSLAKSHKAIRMLEIVKEAQSENRKVIVFSYFLNTLKKIQELLGDNCVSYIDGSVPAKQRQSILNQFEQAPAGSVLVSQISAGGVGLNIQSASVVIICEPQFKPSAENQAIGRAYRMGQSRNVLVYRLLALKTLDEKMTSLLKYKQKVFDIMADKSLAGEEGLKEGVDGNLEVGEKDLRNLIEEEVKRIKEKKGIPTDLEAANEASKKYGTCSRDSENFETDLDDAGEKFVVLTPEFLKESFDLFNEMYFDGVLAEIPIQTGNSPGALGVFCYENDDVHIDISEKRQLTYTTFRNILVHEMCHYYVYTLQGEDCGHNKTWQETVDRLNQENSELNITLYCDEA